MSANKDDVQPLENAAEIIERFGGIRPMAAKIDVAVTTVQGWKKRDTIPANRVQSILEAARELNIEIADTVEQVANQNTPSAPHAEPTGSAPAQSSVPTASAASYDQDQAVSSAVASLLHDDILKSIKDAEARAVTKSSIITVLMIAAAVGALILLVLPGKGGVSEAERQAALEQMQALQSDVDQIKERQGFFGSVIPEDLNQRLGEIKEQADAATEGARTAVEEVRQLSQELVNGQTEALRARMSALETKLDNMADIPLMANLTQRFEAFTVTAGGQTLLEQSTGELSSLLSGVNTDSQEAVNDAIAKAKEESAVLSQSFEDVPADDLKAAALLLTMTQLRSSLGREGESFSEDLVLLQNLVGEDNEALNASIEKLAPHADNGVLTPDGLQSELKSLTGEIVVASLKGEDVSIQDRAKARFNNMFQLEKDGQLVTGTETQATLVQTNNLLEQGNLLGAIAQMETLDGDAAAVAGPWLEKAKATLLAQDMKQTLDGVLAAKSAGLKGYTASGNLLPGSKSQFIYDPTSGTAVLKR